MGPSANTANTNTFGKTKVKMNMRDVAARCDSVKRLRESRVWPPAQTFGRKNGAVLIDISYFLCNPIITRRDVATLGQNERSCRLGDGAVADG